MSSLHKSAAPQRMDVDVFNHPLTPNDVYVLGWIDGVTTVGEIADSSALGAEETLECLTKLAKLGLIQVSMLPSTPPPSVSARPTARPSLDPDGNRIEFLRRS